MDETDCISSPGHHLREHPKPASCRTLWLQFVDLAPTIPLGSPAQDHLLLHSALHLESRSFALAGGSLPLPSHGDGDGDGEPVDCAAAGLQRGRRSRRVVGESVAVAPLQLRRWAVLAGALRRGDSGAVVERAGGRRAQERAQARGGAGCARAAGAKKSVLIVNTDSGGHAVIGFWTAKDLVAAGHSVTIMTVGEESSDKMKKEPFSRFNELRELGVQTVWGEPSDVGAAVGGSTFDVVLDNNGKTLDVVQPVADWAKANGAKQILFISSAGIYKSSFEQPHVEGDAVKEDAGHKQVEDYLAGLGLESWASFRPQYMTGDGNNKDCEEWFFDRIARDRPVCLPSPGIQITNISHVRDLSSMLTLAVEKPEAANGSIFNCCSDRGVTFNGLVKMCAKAAGKEPKIVYYDPKAVGVDAKKAFPFRNMHFYAEPRAAKTKLGWEGKTNLAEDLKERYEHYVKIGRDKKDIKFELDDKILEAVSEPVAA